jgi:NADH-quinone oxidoreductase subunit A
VSQYLPIFAMLVLATLFGVISRVAQRLLIPPHPTPAQVAPYECGIIPSREPPHRFPVRFYLVAMIFIVFDIEIIFFFPYAIASHELGGFGLAAAVIFAVAVFESFVYLIGKGALDWGPAKLDRATDVVSPARTTSTTIRRVGLEGREPAPEPEPEPSRAA